MSDTYATENAAERNRLVKLTAGLSDGDLVRPMAGGWSVATKLLHLAFWDHYCLALLKNWKDGSVSASTVDVDSVNAAVRALSEAIPPRAAVELVCAAAEAVDREIEEIKPALRDAIEASGRIRLLRRAIHRREHLDQIERVIKDC